MKEITYVIACINFLVKIALTVSLDINFQKEKKKKKQVQIETMRKSVFINKSNKTSSNENFLSQEKMRKSVGAFFLGGKNPFSISIKS